MNRALADILATLNVGLAILIVFAGGFLGYRLALQTGENLTFGAGIGLIAGLAVASLICGLLAIATLVEQHLRLIADDVEEMRARDAEAGQRLRGGP